jgi:hypothetical protein
LDTSDSASLGDLLDLPEATQREIAAFLKESSRFQHDPHALADALSDSVLLKTVLTPARRL